MYGTIFKLNIKSGHEEEMLKTLNISTRKPKEMIAWFLMDPDDHGEWIGVAVFKSKQAHIDNANSPEQNENFVNMMKHLESDPVWTDGTYVISEIA